MVLPSDPSDRGVVIARGRELAPDLGRRVQIHGERLSESRSKTYRHCTPAGRRTQEAGLGIKPTFPGQAPSAIFVLTLVN